MRSAQPYRQGAVLELPCPWCRHHEICARVPVDVDALDAVPELSPFAHQANDALLRDFRRFGRKMVAVQNRHQAFVFGAFGQKVGRRHCEVVAPVPREVARRQGCPELGVRLSAKDADAVFGVEHAQVDRGSAVFAGVIDHGHAARRFLFLDAVHRHSKGDVGHAIVVKITGRTRVDDARGTRNRTRKYGFAVEFAPEVIARFVPLAAHGHDGHLADEGAERRIFGDRRQGQVVDAVAIEVAHATRQAQPRSGFGRKKRDVRRALAGGVIDSAVALFAAIEQVDGPVGAGFGDGQIFFAVAVKIADVELHAELSVWRMAVKPPVKAVPVRHVEGSRESPVAFAGQDVQAPGVGDPVGGGRRRAKHHVVDTVAIPIQHHRIHETHPGFLRTAAYDAAGVEMPRFLRRGLRPGKQRKHYPRYGHRRHPSLLHVCHFLREKDKKAAHLRGGMFNGSRRRVAIIHRRNAKQHGVKPFRAFCSGREKRKIPLPRGGG